jgi:hypothetical protein
MVVDKHSNPVETNPKVIVAPTMVHFIGDFYASFVNPLLPAFEERFSLSLMQIGLITGMARFLSFIVQPSVGYLADNYKNRWFVLGGPLLTIVFVSLVGVAPGFSMLLLFICLGSIGSAMYHPPAAGMIPALRKQFIRVTKRFFNSDGECIVRLLTPLGMKYDESYSRAFPFHEMVDGMMNPEMIPDTVGILKTATERGVNVAVMVNNRAGGNAPLIAREIAARFLKASEY